MSGALLWFATSRGRGSARCCSPAISDLIKYTPENLAYVRALTARFQDFARVLEIRRATWDDERVIETLSDLGIGLCNIDQPLLGRAFKPSARGTIFRGLHSPARAELQELLELPNYRSSLENRGTQGDFPFLIRPTVKYRQATIPFGNGDT
jgi:hypothetical protein